MDKLISLLKRRGFVFPSCSIYGGLSSVYTYGPYGAQLKKNIKDLWWKRFVESRSDIVGIDGPIILHPKLWEASGHTKGFNDAMVDCKECKKRFRADHLVEEKTGRDLEGDFLEMDKELKKINCPECGKNNWTSVREFNMMFKTQMNGVESDVYLRPETAGAIFIEFRSILDSMRVKIPFGIAQIGKAFRNEIIAKNFIFRLREFEQMEIEYFISPKDNWEEHFNYWLNEQIEFAKSLGISDLRTYEHPKEKRSHYSKKTVDIEYNYPFGFKELYGLAYRTDFDLNAHMKASGEDLKYEGYIPHVIEPSFGFDRSFLACCLSVFCEEKERIVMKFPKHIAPVQVAVFPLVRNKPELVEKAKEIFNNLKNDFICELDDNGNIGKRYRRQDEIGTPYCVTVDYNTLEDGTVTIRDRDTMEQKRIKIKELIKYLKKEYNV